MALRYLIETPEGEKVLVESLSGHENCTVLEEGVTEPKVPCCERVDGTWVIDKDAAREAMRYEGLPPRAVTLFKEMEARLIVLETQASVVVVEEIFPDLQEESPVPE
jgi:hypothetical protein